MASLSRPPGGASSAEDLSDSESDSSLSSASSGSASSSSASSEEDELMQQPVVKASPYANPILTDAQPQSLGYPHIVASSAIANGGGVVAEDSPDDEDEEGGEFDVMESFEDMEDKDDFGDISFGQRNRRGGRSSRGGSRYSSDARPRPKTPRFKTVPYEVVTIEMPDKNVIDKLISWRTNEEGKEELLVKYKIDRIIDDGDANGEVFYLVKWCAQMYDQATWEPADVVEEIDPSKIEEFHARKMVSKSKVASYANAGKRPPPTEWSKMDESPVYKNDNSLRAYQLEGLNWLLYCWYNRQNSILADEMGLGKTVQSTVFLNYLYQRCNIKGPFLIVTPLSTIGNWEREIRTWTDLNVVVYHGKDTARNLIVETEFFYRDMNGDIIPNVYKFDIILTTYEMAITGAYQLKPIPWRVAVLDEAQRLKNKNSLDELWSLLNFIEPETFKYSCAEEAIYSDYDADTPEKQYLALIQASGKMVLIDKLLRKLKVGGHKVLIFSQMTKLVTRNTYEREMFDRASMKLGLDRAILQRMDAQSAYGTDDSDTKGMGLSKAEVEALLKKGAYGAFLDDEARALIRNAIRAEAVEAEILQDVMSALALEGISDTDIMQEEQIPYPGATKKQITEFRSFLMEAGKDYQDHMTKRAKALLTRLQTIYVIRDVIKPTPEMRMPNVIGGLPRPWWDSTADRDLLIGISRHGYGFYNLMISDSELCFGKRLLEESTGKVEPNGAIENTDLKSEQLDGGSPGKISGLVTNDDEKDELDLVADAKDPRLKDDDEEMDDNKDDAGQDPLEEGDIIKFDRKSFPSAAELGVRIRRIILAYGRMHAMLMKEQLKKQQMEEKMKAKQSRAQAKAQVKHRAKDKAKEQELNKKDRLEFYRTLHSYGVDHDADGQRDWSRFKIVSGLNKADEALEDYYNKLLGVCHGILYPDPENPVSNDFEGITPERAKRLLRRIEAMRKLREDVLPHPQLDDRIKILRHYSRLSLPEWWGPEHDKGYLKAAAKWGMNRIDMYFSDDELPFKTSLQEYLQDQDMDPIEAANAYEQFWLKDSIATKRFASLCEGILNPTVRRRGALQASETPGTPQSTESIATSRKRRRRTTLEVEDDLIEEFDDDVGHDAKRARMSPGSTHPESPGEAAEDTSHGVQEDTLETVPDSKGHDGKRKREHRSGKSSRKRKRHDADAD
ncbi:hypothetical protein HK405_003743, partial [Cladochytrium tenue]